MLPRQHSTSWGDKPTNQKASPQLHDVGQSGAPPSKRVHSACVSHTQPPQKQPLTCSTVCPLRAGSAAQLLHSGWAGSCMSQKMATESRPGAAAGGLIAVCNRMQVSRAAVRQSSQTGQTEKYL
jgi:hypothetical protein